MRGSIRSARRRRGVAVCKSGSLLVLVSLAFWAACPTQTLRADDAQPQEGASESQADSSGQSSPVGHHPVDPSRVEGQDKCIDCHKAEYVSWQSTHHAIETFDMLRTGEYLEQAMEFCEQLEIPLNQIAKSSICVRCHATPQRSAAGNRVLPGVTCEACHGASGGDDGWLNLHAVYGPTGTPREAETEEHHEFRKTTCSRAGQRRVDNPFRLAQACYGCHIIWNEELVNIAEHPSSSERFDFVSWSMGEVRHNFHLDQNRNALVSTLWAKPVWTERDVSLQNRLRLMFLGGKLAQLQVALANRSEATDDGDFADDMLGIVEDVRDDLEGYVEDFSEDDEDEDKYYDPDDLPSLQRAIESVDQVIEFLEDTQDEIDDDDDLSDDQRVTEVYRRTADRFRRAAMAVQQAGDDFCVQHDGSQLSVVDDDLPVISLDDENEAHYSDAWKRRHGIDEP